jgi:hypothetical protein
MSRSSDPKALTKEERDMQRVAQKSVVTWIQRTATTA